MITESNQDLLKKGIGCLLLSLITCTGFSQSLPADQPPEWAKHVIWYELFVERFNNGDPTNDPTVSDITVPGQSIPPEGWTITPWTSDWYTQESWAAKTNKPLSETVFFRRYGGDLQGVLNKLDYLKELGVTALYFRPLNDAPSLHKYDARSYHHIDVNFGPDPQGDKKIIASEILNDPSTWKWTAADKLFLKVIEEAHKRNMKVVLDYSWNHTGIMFWAFQDILKNQQQAVCKNWYAIKSFDNPATPENEFEYDGWVGIQSLPEIKKVNVTTPRVIGNSYEGDINDDAKQHIYEVTKRWLAPEGDLSKGIDGYRMDVADHIGLKFWREWRNVVRSIKNDAYIVGEIWWRKWPEELMDPAPYTKGDVFDAVMFYQTYRPARYFFAKTDFDIDAKQFADSLNFQWKRLRKSNLYAMMNTASSADAPRLLSDFYNPGKYKKYAKPVEDPKYKTGRPDDETYKRLRLYLTYAFTSIGAPHIYNGEEQGMWGGDDPDDRKPLLWPGLKFEKETRTNFQPGAKTYDEVSFNKVQFEFYKKLTAIRNANTVLRDGEFAFTVTERKHLVYERKSATDTIVVAFNLGNEPWSMPIKGKYVDLLTSRSVNDKKLIIKPLEAIILKKAKR